MVETQRHSPGRERSIASKGCDSPVGTTAKADDIKIKHYKPKVLAHQHNDYGYGTALGYAEQSGYRPSGFPLVTCRFPPPWSVEDCMPANAPAVKSEAEEDWSR